MAYMNQERKAKIADALKKVVPTGWKYSLAIQHHSTLVFTLRSAPVDVLEAIRDSENNRAVKKQGWYGLNPYHVRDAFKESEPHIADVFDAIKGAMMEGNHDRSDIMTDYFDVGWYIDINIGRWNKPFEVKP